MPKMRFPTIGFGVFPIFRHMQAMFLVLENGLPVVKPMAKMWMFLLGLGDSVMGFHELDLVASILRVG